MLKANNFRVTSLNFQAIVMVFDTIDVGIGYHTIQMFFQNNTPNTTNIGGRHLTVIDV